MPESPSTGGRKPRVTDTDLVDVFCATTDPVLSTAEVADAVPIKRRGTLNRLRRLEEEGRLDSKQIGGRNTVWWLAEHAGHAVEDRDRGATPTDRTPQDGAEDADAIAEAIARVNTPGSGERREKREQALREMYDYLREHGTARRRDFEEIVDAEDVGYGSFGSFWTNYVKAKDALKQLPNVDAPGEGEHTWTYTGEP